MLRQSTAPLALCVLFLASCNSVSDAPEAPIVPPPSGEVPPSEPPPEDPPSEPVNLALEMSPAPASEAPRRSSRSTYPPLATIYENMDWTRTLKAKNPQGGYVALSLADDGNGDAEAFHYDTDTGEFKLRRTQDFERPSDADSDNYFELKFVAHELPEPNSISFKIEIADQKEIFEDFPVVWLNGSTEFGGLGRNITPLGDIDQDGRPDIAVAAPGRHRRDNYTDLPPAGYHAAGDAYVVSGETLSETPWLDLHGDAADSVWRLAGTDADLNLGYNMLLIDDLDDDEIDDFVFSSNESTIKILSGAKLLDHMQAGGQSTVADLTTGTITMPTNQLIDPRSFASMGDLDDDSLSDLALCAHQYSGGNTVDIQVFAISGAALKEVMTSKSTKTLRELYPQKRAGYFSYTGNHAHCGPMTALGDVNDDEVIDVAIPLPGPDADDAGIMVIDGTGMTTVLEKGGHYRLDAYFRNFFDHREPYTIFKDPDSRGPEQDYMITPLGDVTGDDVSDFGFSWVRYHGADDATFIIKGDENLLVGGAETIDLRPLVQSGRAIQLAATPDSFALNEYRVEPMHALLAPEGGLHSTLLFVGAGETSGSVFDSHSISVDELPSGGTQVAHMPIAGAGKFAIPRANARLLSHVTSVGDLNMDGYGDLAIGWGTKGNLDSGSVLLVSGREIIEARARGETLQPSSLIPDRD